MLAHSDVWCLLGLFGEDGFYGGFPISVDHRLVWTKIVLTWVIFILHRPLLSDRAGCDISLFGTHA